MAKFALSLLMAGFLVGRSPAPQSADGGRTASRSQASKPSLTEEQATGHVYNAGYRGIRGMKLDNSGVWHGRATKDGKISLVSVDREGAVTSG